VISVKQTKVRLTVDLPRTLVEQADTAVADGVAQSRNRLIAHAVEAYLRQIAEARINAQFAQMANDEAYRTLALQLSREFEGADQEALDLGAG
jgi:metal-responsive CopG/Arc/MetJ family transcriptional regulator